MTLDKRLAGLPPDSPAMIGIMFCSPERAGFSPTFSAYCCGAPVPRTLHEDYQ